jgi:hypothetical protein
MLKPSFEGAPRHFLRACTGLFVPCCAAILATWSAPVAAAPKTDVVTFLNGDRLTGEVKGLERGQLSFKTDATGTIDIEWNKVASLQSDQYLHVELTNGLRYAGRAPQSPQSGQLLIRLGDDSKGWPLPIADVIRIAAIDQGDLIDRLDGYVTAGYDYTKAAGLQTFTFSGGLNSRNERRQWTIDGSSTQTSQSDAEDSSRFNLGAAYRWLRPDRWFWQGFANLEGNDELGLDLRTIAGGAYGRFLTQTQRQEWAAYSGLAVTREDYGGGSGELNESVEAVFGTQYWFFIYDTPEASIDATLNLFPSLTESGRVRSEAQLRSRYEIVSDLFFEVSLYATYDSEPGASAESKSDYGVTTSLGYSF